MRSTPRPNLRFSTAEYYRRGIELHTIPYIGEVKLNQLTTRQIQNLYRELQQNGRRRAAQKSKHPGLSSSTIRGVHTMLHSALDRAVKESCSSTTRPRTVSCPSSSGRR